MLIFRNKTKKLLVGESNPGRPRDRRKCYQLHQPGRGYNRIRTGDRRICNPMLYHWAMHPLLCWELFKTIQTRNNILDVQNSCHWRAWKMCEGSYGATVARRIPDPKVGGSNPSRFSSHMRANGLGVWFSLWVREVGGSNPPGPPFLL